MCNLSQDWPNLLATFHSADHCQAGQPVLTTGFHASLTFSSLSHPFLSVQSVLFSIPLLPAPSLLQIESQDTAQMHISQEGPPSCPQLEATVLSLEPWNPMFLRDVTGPLLPTVENPK